MPTTQRQQPQQQGLTPTEQAVIASLVVVLLAGLSFEATVHYATSLLGPLGIPAEAVKRALGLIRPQLEGAPEADLLGPAASNIARTRAVRQALYVLNAARRLAASPRGDAARAAEEAEMRFARQHIDAERGREVAAARVDRAAARYGTTLGWYGEDDPQTTHGCRSAIGRNFNALRPPVIEGRPSWPGMVHVYCRCRPGPPYPGAAMLA